MKIVIEIAFTRGIASFDITDVGRFLNAVHLPQEVKRLVRDFFEEEGNDVDVEAKIVGIDREG